MSLQDHELTPRGRISVWAGTGLGLLLFIGLLTHGFGLPGGSGSHAEAPPLVHQGDKIAIPEGSPLRKRLTVMPVQAEVSNLRRVLPGIGESDPARTAAVLPPLTGRLVELKVSLSQRVTRGQVLACDTLPWREAHELELFKNEGLAPDAAQRVGKFFAARKPKA